MNLKQLLLRCNRIESISPKIGHASGLEFISLRGRNQSYCSNCPENRLVSLPPEIGQLVNLKTLDCQHNHIEDLVDTLGNCISLSSIDLQYNQLSTWHSLLFLSSH